MVAKVVENIKRNEQGGRRPKKIDLLPMPLHTSSLTLVVFGSEAQRTGDSVPFPLSSTPGLGCSGVDSAEVEEPPCPPAACPFPSVPQHPTLSSSPPRLSSLL